ncbi:MAG: O-phosphoserine--tRNA ligase [Candidatus Hadarchaeum sp.]|uniref:O-phosphoserine--tRNA ligase n=1 Tax=Candidatus Hadarchaeum sp. TaxID=2883567 RepID=UPI003D0F91DF
MSLKFDLREIRSKAESDYERTWLESGELLEKKGRFFALQQKAKPHPLQELIIEVRRVFLELGFTEVVLPIIVDKREVQAQYGPEAAVILDRVFFLAGLERPDIGIGRKKLQEIKKIVPDFDDLKKLQGIFRRYKKGEIEADSLVEVMAQELGIREEQATAVLSLFPEFKKLRPVPMDLTLRSHTTAAWFGALRELQHREPLPLQLFSIGPKFRREQRLDESHLYESWTASMVIMAERMSLEDGEEITKQVFSRLGFDEVKLVRKKTTSKYYAPQTESEVFVRHPKTGEYLEVGDAGFYSPVALSNYDIAYPVFNLGIGLERLLMIRTGETDIRRLVFPYLYGTVKFSDEELAAAIKLQREPSTEAGKRIAEAIVRTAREHADEPSPCEFKAYEGELAGRRVVVKVVEPENSTKLIGPAGFNEIYVYDGNVVGVPPKGWEDNSFLNAVRSRGRATGISYLAAFAALAAAEIEQAAQRGEKEVKIRVRAAKSLADVNLRLDEAAQRYITSNNKKIDVRGPVFTTVVAEFKT